MPLLPQPPHRVVCTDTAVFGRKYEIAPVHREQFLFDRIK
jgi:hypothetical protein